MKLLFAGVMILFSILTGCKKDDDPEPDPSNTEGLVYVGQAYTDQGSMLIKVYATDSLYCAFNNLFIEVRDSATNTVISNAEITLLPQMIMMGHAAPFENPSSTAAVNGLFPCAVVFQMPGDMGWTLDVTAKNLATNNEGTAQLAFAVKNPTLTRTKVITALNDSSKLIISYVQPKEPKVGLNDFEITIHRKESMMSFPSAENYTVEIEPEMPSMGHGSPNNVNPVHTGSGHYKGQVNFTMTGEWNINLRIMDGTAPVDTTSYFEVVL
ncbi:MAG: FixH family protein [Bacteroidia bacterium]